MLFVALAGGCLAHRGREAIASGPNTAAQAIVGTRVDYSSVGNRLELRVMARDSSRGVSRAIPLRVSACALEFRLDTSALRTGQPVWRSSAARRDLACARAVTPGTRELESYWPIADILGDSLPARWYYLGYTLHLADGRSLVNASGRVYLSTSLPTWDLSVLRFTSGSDVSAQYPQQLRAWTVVTNGGTHPVIFGSGGCPLNIRLWRSPERRGRPVWRSEFSQPAQPKGAPPIGHFCFSIEREHDLTPGDTASFPLNVPLTEVLADSLPDGRYWVGVQLGLMHRFFPRGERDTSVDLPAGDVMLHRQSDQHLRPEPAMRGTPPEPTSPRAPARERLGACHEDPSIAPLTQDDRVHSG